MLILHLKIPSYPWPNLAPKPRKNENKESMGIRMTKELHSMMCKTKRYDLTGILNMKEKLL